MPADDVERLRAVLAEAPGLEARRMFGGTCWMLHGHMLCCAREGTYLFRFAREEEAEVLAQPGARQMAQGGRVMRGFVWVDADQAQGESLEGWVARAARHVARLGPMAPKPERKAKRPS